MESPRRSKRVRLANLDYKASPACPGIVKARLSGLLSKIPRDSDIFEEFNKLKADSDLSNEEVFFRFID
jgi:hypothetical protein